MQALRSLLIPRIAHAASYSSDASAKVGFVGLGMMGRHMAQRLHDAGHSVTVFDLDEKILKEKEEAGMTVAGSPREVVDGAEVVVTMLPSSPHVEKVYTGEDGLLLGNMSNTLFIDSSTISPGVARSVANKVRDTSADIVDAPVSGGTPAAEAGTLTFMVGGSETAFNRARPFLEVMGRNVVHCGASGTGQVAKVCNNLVLGISMIAVAEGMNLGSNLGMDPKVLAGILNTSTGRCWSSDTYNPCPEVEMPTAPSTRGYTGGFAVPLMLKDLGLALESGRVSDSSLPMGQLAHSLYGRAASNDEFKSSDFSVVYRMLREYPFSIDVEYSEEDK